MSRERRQRPREGIVAMLGWLQRLGEPIELIDLPADYTSDYVLYLRTDLGEMKHETELMRDAEKLPWYDEWSIIGCFVSYEYERLRFVEAEALLDAAKKNLSTVLEVRLDQAQRSGGFRGRA